VTELHRTDAGNADPAAAEADILRELRETLEFRMATSDILRVISRSAFDLTSVLLTVLTNAKVLCGAETAVLFRYLDGAYRFAVGHGTSSAYERLERQQAIQPGRETLVGRAALERKTVQIVDAWSDPDYAKKDDARLGEVRCMLGVPLLREGVPIGVIGLGRARVEPYTERQIELVSTFADQAVIAIENVRLFEELQSAREAAERERDTAEAARAEAEAANRAKSTFLAAMSHEIRTPLNGVLGMMEVLERSRLEPTQARNVAVMRESAQALLRIIDDILDFSKIDAGRMDIETLSFSLSGLVAGTVETMLSQAQQKRLALFADPPSTGPDWITGDPMRVRQILFNLIGNAIKFTDRGFVRIGTESRVESDGAVRVGITVTDSGIGMDAATRSRLFEPFMQADSSTTRRFGGTGLGLSIVRRLAQLMGGDVAVESAPDKGSRFTVTLSLAEASPAPPPAEEPVRHLSTASAQRSSTTRLLVVDDHPVNLEVILRQLELIGLSAEIAEDGAAALALWRSAPHDVVLLDLHMPVLDGFDLAKAIRREEAKRDLPRTGLIAVTADALKGEDVRCFAAGMDGFLSKPVSIDALARTLGRWIPDLVTTKALADERAGALFDPEALRSLFGGGAALIAGLVHNFADGATRDIAKLRAAPDTKQLAASAHRLKGAARMAGARLVAEQAARVEAAANAGDLAGARRAADGMERLLAETLRVMRLVD
jgi:signal transduction histidine kinase/ActR/RegA family two-component response regulator/HPt (histidine-containing phosphotransfer) domain-containing protein